MKRSRERSNMWSPERERHFISLYKAEPVLWDKVHEEYKYKKETDEAWIRISEKLGISVKDLKLRRSNLYNKFVYHLRRHQEMSQVGDRLEIYDPDWFADDPIYSFFGNLYQTKLGCKKAAIKYPVKGTSMIENYAAKVKMECPDSTQEGNPEYSVNNYLTCLLKESYLKNPPKPSITEAPINLTLNEQGSVRNVSSIKIDTVWASPSSTTSNHATHPIQPGPSNPPMKREGEASGSLGLNGLFQVANDDCYLYATLLASKMRKLSEKDRLQLMYKIDALLIRETNPPVNNSITPSYGPHLFPFSFPRFSTSRYAYYPPSIPRNTSSPYFPFPILPRK